MLDEELARGTISLDVACRRNVIGCYGIAQFGQAARSSDRGDGASFARHVDGVVAFEWIVRARLIGERVGRDVAFLQATQEMDDVAEPSDGNALSLRFEFECAINRAIEIFNDLVEISIVHALGESFARNLRNQANAMIHSDCEWLRAAHAAATARDIERALECSAEMLTRAFGVGFVGSLHDALRADVDP